MRPTTFNYGKKVVESVESIRNDGVTYCGQEESRNNHLFFRILLITLLSVLFSRSAYCGETEGIASKHKRYNEKGKTTQPHLSIGPSKSGEAQSNLRPRQPKVNLQTTLNFSKRNREQGKQQQTGRTSHSSRQEDRHFHFYHKDT